MEPHKFSQLQGSSSLPYVYPNVWEVEQTTGPQRLVIAPSGNHIDLLIELTRQLPEPFGVLYVLVVPRGGSGEPGRYQSAQPCDRKELERFLRRFQKLLESDARQHLWLLSLPSQAQLIYDNHNVIYAYGPLDAFKRVLTAKGLTEGQVQFPSPHAHNYNAEFDEDERQIMSYWEWIYFPLAEGDD